MAFVDRIYDGKIPDYSIVEKQLYMTNAEYTNAQTRLLNEVSDTAVNNGKFKILRNLFEHILFHGARIINSNQKYRRVIIDKCTEMIQDIISRECIHPKDKIGLCNLVGQVQRMCLKYE